ncbi:hypothetical protein QFC96_05345 [Latilactobacillus curvatus]|uniref:hypothetical protein n=1 Tax=Latilactobacillus curvatus TaxID=28038 RepID=UPI0024BAD786|nr:hypothetical protein [Latilactobacillus curvatus]WHQ77328.1 hypothetical protein QFC96_05345 [Latilactobacillus curvatus]
MVNTILKEADLFCPNSVRINFTIYHLNMDRLPDGAKLGRHIGHLERFAILILFYTHNVASIAVIVAIKALTRFKAIESNEHHFAEYYLIGSLLSLIFGCLGGYLLSLIAH